MIRKKFVLKFFFLFMLGSSNLFGGIFYLNFIHLTPEEEILALSFIFSGIFWTIGAIFASFKNKKISFLGIPFFILYLLSIILGFFETNDSIYLEEYIVMIPFIFFTIYGIIECIVRIEKDEHLII